MLLKRSASKCFVFFFIGHCEKQKGFRFVSIFASDFFFITLYVDAWISLTLEAESLCLSVLFRGPFCTLNASDYRTILGKKIKHIVNVAAAISCLNMWLLNVIFTLHYEATCAIWAVKDLNMIEMNQPFDPKLCIMSN